MDAECERPLKGKFSYFYESTNSYIYELTIISPRRRKRRTGKEERTGWECRCVGWLNKWRRRRSRRNYFSSFFSSSFSLTGGLHGDAARLEPWYTPAHFS